MRLMLLAIVALLAVPATAAADSQTDSSGDVTAEITWTAATDQQPAHGLRVTIARAGRRLVDDAIAGAPPFYPGDRKAVRALDLDGDGEPEVLVDAYSGGAHCCESTRVYRFAGGRYAFTTREWGNQGYDLVDLKRDGTVELVSADDAFAYAFGSFAESLFPVRIFDDRGGRLVERTRDYPGAVRRDLADQRRMYRSARAHHRNVRPALAAYAADLHHLGRHAEARRVVADALRHSELRRHGRFDFPPFGRAYVRALDNLLARGGYLGR